MCGRKEVRGNEEQSQIRRCLRDSGSSQRQCDYFQNTCYLLNIGGSKCLHELSVLHSPSCCSGASQLGPGTRHLSGSSYWCLSPLIPTVGLAALLLTVNSHPPTPLFTLSCSSTFCLTSSLDVFTLQTSCPSPSTSSCDPLAEENPLHNPSSNGVANGANHE